LYFGSYSQPMHDVRFS